jgi:hypothetical protein
MFLAVGGFVGGLGQWILKIGLFFGLFYRLRRLGERLRCIGGGRSSVLFVVLGVRVSTLCSCGRDVGFGPVD